MSCVCRVVWCGRGLELAPNSLHLRFDQADVEHVPVDLRLLFKSLDKQYSILLAKVGTFPAAFTAVRFVIPAVVGTHTANTLSWMRQALSVLPHMWMTTWIRFCWETQIVSSRSC